MTFTADQYVPLLKWRMGEYQALMRLEESVKDEIVPLVVIPPIEYDFEEQQEKKTVDEHVSPFAKRFCEKWGQRAALIDVHPSLEAAIRDSGELVAASIFDELRERDAKAIPVFGVNRSKQYLQFVRTVNETDQGGACLRVDLSDLTDSDFAEMLVKSYNITGLKPDSVDLLIDLESPKIFEPYPEFASIIANLIPNVGNPDEFRSFAVAATAYPESLSVTKPGGSFARHEWHLYQALVYAVSDTGRIPSFGDYGMERPEFLSLDMRLVKPAGKVVYTTATDWIIRKGSAFREDPKQMRQHCRDIVESPHFRGSAFSAGDKFIKECADGVGPTSNLTMWKSVGMNHHMTQVVEDLAKYHGA